MPPISDALTKYGSAFQTKIITCLLADQDFAVTVYDMIKPELFDTEANQWLVRQIKEYYYEYKVTPTLSALKVKINEVSSELLRDSIVDELREVTKNIEAPDLEFVKNETTIFCKNQMLKEAIIKSVDLIQTGRYDEIKRVVDNAMRAGTHRDVGLNYLKDFDSILADIARDTIESGWEPVDYIMDGGLAGGELGVVVAPSGIGKSWFLQALGVNALKAGKNVVHYTLELNQAYVGMRYATIFSEVPVANIKDNKEHVKEIITKQCKGELLIKYFPTRAATVQTLHTHLKTIELMGHEPDLILVDYADLLRGMGLKNDAAVRHILGDIYEDLRGMSGEFQIPIWTASQSNRSSLEDEIIGAEKIAESYAKIMTADFVMSLSRKIEDKIANTGRVHVIKNRFGPDGMTYPTTMNTSIGKIDIYDSSSITGQAVQKKQDNGSEYTRKLLAKKYKDFETN
jgi:replicative DNA helicase